MYRQPSVPESFVYTLSRPPGRSQPIVAMNQNIVQPIAVSQASGQPITYPEVQEEYLGQSLTER